MDGFRYVQEKNYSKALECFNAALKEKPNSWAIMESIGNCPNANVLYGPGATVNYCDYSSTHGFYNFGT
jgi:hypothetical protein